MASRPNKRRRDSSEQALPSNEDWTFRVMVISSATNLHSDVFKEAVRELVRICFPDGILDQLGQQVVEQHMREEQSNAENIQRMSEVFRSDMVQRLIGMISNYFDTPDQIVSAVQSALELRQNTSRGPLSTVVEESLPRKKTKPNIDLERREPISTSSQDVEQEDTQVDMDVLVTPTEDATSTPNTVQHRYKDKKISATWAWNIDPTDFTTQAVNDIFPRTADLFAYHALPIIKQKLGSVASRKELRREMQSLIDELPQNEFVQWTHSLEKLIAGDHIMLVRSEPSHIAENFPQMTPAPGRLRPRADVISDKKSTVKQETTEERVSETSTKGAVAQVTTAVRHLSREAHKSELPTIGVNATVRRHATNSQMSRNAGSTFSTPVLQLLWGSDNFALEQYPYDALKITEAIMENMNTRVPAERVVMSGLGGQNQLCTKEDLRSRIFKAFPKPGRPVSYMKIKKSIESALIHWVIAEPKAFPELKAMPFVFAHIVPSMAVVMNLLFGSWSTVSELNGSQMWEGMLEALDRRGISEASAGTANIDCLQIDSLCDRQRYPEATRRALLERVFRRLAFVHREKFPELQATPLVTAWQQKTGLTW